MTKLLRICAVCVSVAGLLAGFYFLPAGDLTGEPNDSPLFAASLNSTTQQLEGGGAAPLPGIDSKGGGGSNLVTCEITCGPTCNQTTCGTTCVSTCQFTCSNTCSQVTCEATCVATCAATCANTCAQVTCASTCATTCTYTCENPITLAAFTAQGLTDHVLVDWSTGSEIENCSFEILRATNPQGNFEIVATLLANGGMGTTEYSYADRAVEVGIVYYYMIQDVNLSGYRTLHQNVVSAQIVGDFNLAQNYPNPFNPETVIRFTLPYAAQTRLAVYDLGGRLVQTLVNGHLSGGAHQFTWNAAKLSPPILPSGMYVYRLQAGELTATGKMLYVK